MLNKVLLIGNLTRDVEIRYTQGGTAIGKFGLAVNRKWKDGNSGESREETMFIDINCFGRSAEIAHQFLAKGRQVLVEGRLVLDTWTDQNGQKKSKHVISAESIQFLGGGRDREDNGSAGDNANNNAPAPKNGNGSQKPAPKQNNAPAQEPPVVEIDDEEIPF